MVSIFPSYLDGWICGPCFKKADRRGTENESVSPLKYAGCPLDETSGAEEGPLFDGAPEYDEDDDIGEGLYFTQGPLQVCFEMSVCYGCATFSRSIYVSGPRRINQKMSPIRCNDNQPVL